MFRTATPFKINLLIIVFLFFFGFRVLAQEKVILFAGDSLKITADLYIKNYQDPFIILFHQAESSRGEYIEIAPRLMKLGYNCLAVDLRSGGKSNYISNETAARARELSRPAHFIDARQDMLAAIDYVCRYNKKPVILFGSSYSASLALLLASELPNIKAVIAFSPGEYFRPAVEVRDKLGGIKAPVFIAVTEIENSYISEFSSNISSHKTVFKPSEGRGVHGAKALWDDSPGSKECWFNLTFFFSKLKEI